MLLFVNIKVKVRSGCVSDWSDSQHTVATSEIFFPKLQNGKGMLDMQFQVQNPGEHAGVQGNVFLPYCPTHLYGKMVKI